LEVESTEIIDFAVPLIEKYVTYINRTSSRHSLYWPAISLHPIYYSFEKWCEKLTAQFEAWPIHHCSIIPQSTLRSQSRQILWTEWMGWENKAGGRRSAANVPSCDYRAYRCHFVRNTIVRYWMTIG
jgi:hypothetical protein